jgi:hypothetical protein
MVQLLDSMRQVAREPLWVELLQLKEERVMVL